MGGTHINNVGSPIVYVHCYMNITKLQDRQWYFQLAIVLKSVGKKSGNNHHCKLRVRSGYPR